MFNSSRVIIVALGLTLSVSLGQAQDQTDRGKDNPATQQPAQQLPIPLPVQIIENDEASQATKAREDEARQREIDDLVAQQGMNAATQSMNVATEKMAFYSLLSTIFIGLGTLLLVWTLLLTRSANRAAQDAVAETRRIGEAQVRAYISVRNFKVLNFRPNDIGSFAFEIENVGPSPARNFRFIFNYTAPLVGEKMNFVFSQSDANWSIPSRDLQAGNKIHHAHSMISPIFEPYFKEIMSGDRAFYIFGAFKYQTVFGRIRRGVVCARMMPDSYENGTLSFTIGEKHNKSN